MVELSKLTGIPVEWMPWCITLWVVASFIGWFLLNALHYGLNSGQLGRGRWWVFQCIWEEGVLMSIPGGLDRKVEKLKYMVGTKGWGSFFTFSGKSWNYEELRVGGDAAFRDCARHMFQGPISFWFWHIFFYFLVGSLATAFIVVQFVLGGLAMFFIDYIGGYLSRSLQWSPLPTTNRR